MLKWSPAIEKKEEPARMGPVRCRLEDPPVNTRGVSSMP